MSTVWEPQAQILTMKAIIMRVAATVAATYRSWSQ